MAIFHFTVKIVGRSKGKSVISASAYLNGDVMKNEETGRISYYTSKKEVVYTSLMMCKNAPLEWLQVPEENIKRFQQSIRYKRAGDKEAALEKFKITFQKQRLWNEVLKIEKNADAQLGRSFEFSLPKEWSRQEQIDYTTEYIQKTFVEKGMCADWSIHDKGDGRDIKRTRCWRGSMISVHTGCASIMCREIPLPLHRVCGSSIAIEAACRRSIWRKSIAGSRWRMLFCAGCTKICAPVQTGEEKAPAKAGL